MPESYKEDGRPAQQWYWGDWFSAFDVRLCSLEARGLWIDMLGIMFQSEVRGTLTINGKKVNSKTMAKIVGESEIKITKLWQKLEAKKVFSRLEDGTIICRRMYRESTKKEGLSKIRSEAGKKGAEKRWQQDSKDKAKIAPSSSTPSSIPASTSNHKDTKVSFSQTKKNTNPKIEFNFEERKWLNITIEDKSGWLTAYPACDIDQELRKMREWLLANPDKKKKNYRRFIVNWLVKNQDKGGTKSSYEDKRKKALDDWEKEPMED